MDFGFVLVQSLSQAIGVAAIIYGLAAVGLNLQFGYTGLLNFGVVAFVAVGSYSVGVIVITMGLSLWLAVPVALFMSVVLALILGIPTLRLRADYLAIVTIAMSEIVRQVVRSLALREWLGGPNGLNGKMGKEFHDLNPLPADVSIPFITLTRQDLWVVIVGWTLIAVISFMLWLLVRSPWGRVLKGIREDEFAVTSLGKNVYLYKMQALVIGGMIGAVAGIIWAVAKNSVQPDTFMPDFTFYVWTILLLGGAARILGPIVGTMIFFFLFVFVGEFLNQGMRAGWFTFIDSTDIGAIRFILVGVGLMALMIFRPQGIFGDRKELAIDGR